MDQFTNIYMYPQIDLNPSGVLQRVWVIIGSELNPNDMTIGAFNQFTNCIFWRSTDANYAPNPGVYPGTAGASSQPIYVFGRHNVFKNIRIGPEAQLSPLTQTSIDFFNILAPNNGIVDSCQIPVGNVTVNSLILFQNTIYNY